jgi:hypothetical protein
VLRITHHRRGEGEVLQVEGRLVGPWVDELRQVAEGLLAEGRRPRLDLDEVRFAEAEGAALIRELTARGCEVLRRSRFVEELLRRMPR